MIDQIYGLVFLVAAKAHMVPTEASKDEKNRACLVYFRSKKLAFTYGHIPGEFLDSKTHQLDNIDAVSQSKIETC